MRISKEDWIKSQTVTPQPPPQPVEKTGPGGTQPWYTQEVVPSVPNWFLAGVGAVVLIGYFMFRKKSD
jgi:hypothetical protein